MDGDAKPKKRLQKPPPQDSSTKIQTISSSPIPATPMNDLKKGSNMLSKSIHRCRAPAQRESSFNPKSSTRVGSAHVIESKATTGDAGSSSLDRPFQKRVPSTSFSDIRRVTKVVSPGSFQSQRIEQKGFTYSHKPCARIMSAQNQTPGLNREDVGSSSMDRIPKERKGRKCLKDGDFKGPKAGGSTKLKKSAQEQDSLSGSSEKLTSKPIRTCIQKASRTKAAKRRRELLRTYSSKDIKQLKEDCHGIEIVFENRRKKDRTTRMDNINILGKLYFLICYGGLEETRPREKVIHYITTYLCNNSYLLSQLVYIISEGEDLQTCLYTIKLLHQLLIKGWIIEEGERLALKSALNCSAILGTLIESMHLIHKRFAGNMEYKAASQKAHSYILQIIICVCKSQSARKQLRHASEDAVKLVGRLTGGCHVNKELANSLLEAIKIICIGKDNCEILASKKFFDGVCTCYDLTHKIYTVPMIFKVMSRIKTVLNCMSGSERVITLIIDLLCYSGRKPINKRNLLTTLYRIAKEGNGLKILSKNEMFYKLLHFFRKSEISKLVNHRLATIKAYSILNRAVNQIILPSIELKRELCLPESVKKCLEEESVSEESEPENDESEDDSENNDDSDETDASATDITIIKKSTENYMKQQDSASEELLTDMSPFYVELLLTDENTNYDNIFKFDIYEGIVRLTNSKIIENRVHRDLNNDQHAYPDAAMLDPELDEHTLDPFINIFSKESLCQKLRRSRGIQMNTFIPRVVYDLDELQSHRKQTVVVPHPSTFVPNKLNTQNPANIISTLKFESRFECGNLRKAIQIERYEYELLLTPDTNTIKGLQWFYFQVSNMTPGITYTFNIANFLKLTSQHNYGMQPLMFSVMDHTLYRTGWRRVGEEVVYFGNNYTDETGEKQYRTLLFSVSFPHPNDFVYFAYHYPYTYTRLMIKLFPFVNFRTHEIYTRLDKLCTTVKTRNEISLLTITSTWNRSNGLGIPLRRRPIVFITARVHPGETNASWIMEGVINFLLRQGDPDAENAREHFIFKIIPMLNPEGVIYGNTRNGLTGSDLNRCWARPNKITCPEIYYPKRLIACAKKQLKLPVAAYIDIHGHSRKRFFFFYGCNPKMSWNKKDKANGNLIDTVKILPEMVRDVNPNIRLSQCKYKVTKNRESTGRVVMWREFDIKHSYTLECSYSFASEKQSVNTKILTEVGASVIASLGRLADQAYSSRKVVPSLGLDFTYINSPPPPAPPALLDARSTATRLKEGADAACKYPFMVGSRVIHHSMISRGPAI